MVKLLAVLGTLGAVGTLSLCDLCDRGPHYTAGSLTAAAYAAAPATLPAAGAAARTAAPATDPRTVTLDVQGMTCGGCVIGVRKVLTRLRGVTKASVSYEQHRAVVTYDPAKVTVQQMIAAIKTLGYTATEVAG
jgi:mercuric transport protein